MDENFKAEIDQNLKNMLMTHWLNSCHQLLTQYKWFINEIYSSDKPNSRQLNISMHVTNQDRLCTITSLPNWPISLRKPDL